MVFAADDLGAWLVGLLADAGRKKLITVVLGSEQERARRQAASAAVEVTAEEVSLSGGTQAGQVAMVIGEVSGRRRRRHQRRGRRRCWRRCGRG